jgi:hypothetical protein
MIRHGSWLPLLLLTLPAACLGPSAPEPKPMSLNAPPPPEPRAGEIRIYGHDLPEERVNAVRERLRRAEPAILRAYDEFLIEDPYVSGTLQVRIGVNREGQVAEVARISSDVSDALALRIREVLSPLEFGRGPEVYAYYTLAFHPKPFEVLRLTPEFATDPPVIAAEVENRSEFRLPAVSVTVSVLGPEKAKPLRIYRRRLEVAFAPGERRTLRVPVGSEWATGRNSFLVDVLPAE